VVHILYFYRNSLGVPWLHTKLCGTCSARTIGGCLLINFSFSLSKNRQHDWKLHKQNFYCVTRVLGVHHKNALRNNIQVYIYMYIHIYINVSSFIHTSTYTYVYMYVYIYKWWSRSRCCDRLMSTSRSSLRCCTSTPGSHCCRKSTWSRPDMRCRAWRRRWTDTWSEDCVYYCS